MRANREETAAPARAQPVGDAPGGAERTMQMLWAAAGDLSADERHGIHRTGFGALRAEMPVKGNGWKIPAGTIAYDAGDGAVLTAETADRIGVPHPLNGMRAIGTMDAGAYEATASTEWYEPMTDAEGRVLTIPRVAREGRAVRPGAHPDRVQMPSHHEEHGRFSSSLMTNRGALLSGEPCSLVLARGKHGEPTATEVVTLTTDPLNNMIAERGMSLKQARALREAINLAATVVENSTVPHPCVTPYELCRQLGIEHPTLRQQENLVETLETGYSINVDIDMSKNPLVHWERSHIKGPLIPCIILEAGEGERSEWVIRFSDLPPTYIAAKAMGHVRIFPKKLMRLGPASATDMNRALWLIVRERALEAWSAKKNKREQKSPRLHIRLMRDPKHKNDAIEIEESAGVNVKTKVQRDRAERVLVEAVEEMVQEGYLTDYRVCTESGKTSRGKEPHAYIELIP